MFFSLFAQKEEFRNVSLNSAISKQRITRVSCSKISQKRLNFPEVSKNTVFDISRVVHHLEHSNFKLDRFMHIHYMLNYGDKTDTFCNFTFLKSNLADLDYCFIQTFRLESK